MPKIALAQINPTVGDIEGNKKKILEYINKAKAEGADIVVFPEMAICGYPPEDLLLKESFIYACEAAFLGETNNTITEQLPKDITVVVGLPTHSGDGIHNSAYVISSSGSIRNFFIYDKTELPNYGVFDEKRYFTPGIQPIFFTIKDKKFMVTICEDIWVQGSIVRTWAKEHKVDIVLNLSASPFHKGKLPQRMEIIADFARETNTTVCYCNMVGGQDELVFDGTSLVIDNKGELLEVASRFKEDLLMFDSQIGRMPRPQPFSPECEEDELKEVYDALVLGTRDYIQKNGFKQVVLGISGGIDSALTATIAVDAIGKENVIGVTMPSHYSSKETFNDAILLSRNLGIHLDFISITGGYEGLLFESRLDKFLSDDEKGIEYENLQARIRCNILMALSNKNNWMVLSTGNKSELSVGYSTIYGDLSGGFAVIKDVPKTMVFKLARYVNSVYEREVIPETTITRPPSAELRPNQKDEDSLPPYDVLDPILQMYVEEDKSIEEICKNVTSEMLWKAYPKINMMNITEAKDTTLGLVQRIVGMCDRAEYKRRQAPPGVKITHKAFGKDRRLPITNKFKG